MESRGTIQQAFETLLCAEPYEKMTVSGICKEAYVSRKTFYHHFRDKEDLFLSIIVRDFEAPVRDLRRLLDVDNLKSATTLMTERALELVLQKQVFYREVFSERNHQLIAAYIDMLTDLNDEIYQATGISADEARFAARAIAAASAYSNKDWLQSGCARSVTEESRMRVQWLFARFRELDGQNARW